MATNSNSILLTGGAGYIGSHTCVALVQAAVGTACWRWCMPSSRPVVGRFLTAWPRAVPAMWRRSTTCVAGQMVDAGDEHDLKVTVIVSSLQ
jgi:uncharacterized protein YbjT (DUF2867 family)